MAKDDVNTITKEAGLAQTLTRAIVVLGGGTAIFYALGFTIVNTYIRRVGLEGMFWLTKEFYVDAGANFLLEMIRSPLLAPQLFFSYLFILSLLVPKEKNLFAPLTKRSGSQTGSEAIFSGKQWAKLASIFVIIIATFIFTTFFNFMQESPMFLSIIRYANFFDSDKALLSASLTSRDTSLVFFCFVTPLIVILGDFFFRFRGILKEKSKSKVYYHAAFIVYMVLIASIPISYANHLYDWKMVPLKDPQVVEQIINGGAEETEAVLNIPIITKSVERKLLSTRIWLLGQSDDQYFFLTKRGIYSEGVIEVIDATKIEHLNFAYDPNQGDFLSEQIKPSVPLAVTMVEDPFEYLNLRIEGLELE